MSSESENPDPEVLNQAPVTEGLASSGNNWIRRLFPFVIGLILVSATVWSISIFAMTTYRDYLHIPGEVEVPEITGLEIKEAFEVIEEAGLRLQAHESRYDKKVKKRIVLEQNPAGGKKVRQGRTILAVVSLGPELMKVPKITGESLRTAKIAISNNKLRVGKIEFEPPSYGMDEEVIKQNPSAGKEVPRGQEVHLIVRRGSQ